MRPELLHQRFRILLHVLKRLDLPHEDELSLPGRDGATVDANGWLGFETSRFDDAVRAVKDLERHLQAMRQPPTKERWPAYPEEVPRPFLNGDQNMRLQALLNGLMSAFLEEEGEA